MYHKKSSSQTGFIYLKKKKKDNQRSNLHLRKWADNFPLFMAMKYSVSLLNLIWALKPIKVVFFFFFFFFFWNLQRKMKYFKLKNK